MVLLHFKELAFEEAKRLTADLAGGRTGNRKAFATKSQSSTIFLFTHLVNLRVLEPLRQWFDEKLTNRLSASLSGKIISSRNGN